MRNSMSWRLLLLSVVFLVCAILPIIYFNTKKPTQVEILKAAIENDDVDSLKRYLHAGGDPDFLFRKGGSYKSESRPLHVAVSSGSIGVCEVLVKVGADVDSRDFSGRTPIMCLFSYDVDQGARSKILKLLAKRSNLDLVDIGGMNILHYAADFGSKGEYDYILGLRGDLSVTEDASGRTPYEIMSKRFGPESN